MVVSVNYNLTAPVFAFETSKESRPAFQIETHYFRTRFDRSTAITSFGMLEGSGYIENDCKIWVHFPEMLFIIDVPSKIRQSITFILLMNMRCETFDGPNRSVSQT